MSQNKKVPANLLLYVYQIYSDFSENW